MPRAKVDGYLGSAASKRGLRKAMVCSVSDGPHGPEVVMRFNAEQWLVAYLTHEAVAGWRGLIGHAVFVDSHAQPPRILWPTSELGHD